MVAIWAGLFFLTFTLLNSRSEEEILRVQKVLAASQAWESYSSAQSILFDDQEVLHIESISQQDPYLTWVTSKTKVTDTEDFRFDLYFQPEAIYIHTLNSNAWNKTDYTSSVAGELQGVKDPFSFWLRLLNSAESIETREDSGQGTYYLIKLKPFHDEVHGIRFDDVEKAAMEVRTSTRPSGVKEIRLNVDLKSNIIRGYDQISYRIQFSDINEPKTIQLPHEAATAKPLLPR